MIFKHTLVTSTGAGLRYCLWAMLVASLVLISCTRTITTKSRTYSITGSEPDDSDKLRKRYASGFEMGEDGTIQTNKKNLYEDKSFRNTKNYDTDLKSYRLGKKDFNMNEYRTPEYLTRQKKYRTKDSRMNKDARESDVNRFTTINNDDEAWIKKAKPGFLDWLNPFSKKKAYRGAEKTYRTSINRTGSKAVDRAPSPEPMSQIEAGSQNQVNPALSMDDVKKMLNPGSFRQQNRR